MTAVMSSVTDAPETQQGLVLEVSLRNTGDFLAQDYVASNTSFQVFDTSDFPVPPDHPQIMLAGVIYTTTNVDESTGFISFPGHPANLSVNEPVYLYPLAQEKWAMVKFLREDDPVSVRIPHSLSDKFLEGVRDDASQESVTMVMEKGTWVIQDVFYKQPELDITMASIGTDGAVPTLSPTPDPIGGVGAYHVRWAGVTNNDPVTYRLYASTTPSFTKDATTQIYEGPNTSFTYRPNPPYTGVMYFSVAAGDEDGYAAASAEVSATLAPIGTYPQDFYVGNLVFDQMIGGTINADVTLASVFSTRPAGTGGGVEVDPTGIRIYDSLNAISTLLSPDLNQFKGAIEALAATFTGPAAFRHTGNEISQSAILNVRGATTAPVGTATVDQPILTTDPIITTGAHDFQGCYGLCWTGTEFAAAKDSEPPVVRRQTSADVTLAPGTSKHWNPWGGVTLIGGNWYLLGWTETSPGVFTWQIKKFNSSGVLQTTVTYTPIAGAFGSGGNQSQGLGCAAIGSDGTNVLVAEFDDANDRYRIQVRDATTLAVSSTVNTTTNSGFTGPVVAVEQGNFDFGSSRYIVMSKVGAHHYPFSNVAGTWTYQPTEAFHVPISGQMSGFDWDGTRFWSTRAKSIAGNAYIYKHTTSTFVALDANSTHRVRLTWRDTDATGGTHETNMGTEVTFLRKKRQPIRIVAPAIPDSGGTDDPDAFSAYISNATSARTDFWLQTLPAAGVQELILKDTVVFSGTNPPASNNFPSATPGKIVANNMEIVGDGTITRGVALQLVEGQWKYATGNIDTNTSGTFSDITGFSFTAEAGGVYAIDCVFFIINTGTATADIRFGFTWTGTGVMSMGIMGNDSTKGAGTSSSPVTADARSNATATSPLDHPGIIGLDNTVQGMGYVSATYECTTAGTVQMRFAQGTANASFASRVSRGSRMHVQRMA